MRSLSLEEIRREVIDQRRELCFFYFENEYLGIFPTEGHKYYRFALFISLSLRGSSKPSASLQSIYNTKHCWETFLSRLCSAAESTSTYMMNIQSLVGRRLVHIEIRILNVCWQNVEIFC